MSSKIYQLDLFTPPEQLEGEQLEDFLKNLRSSMRALFAKSYENEQRLKRIEARCEARCESTEAATFNLSRQMDCLIEAMKEHG